MFSPSPVPISLVVLTQDEEHNIAACLASAMGFDDIAVLDSGSTDRTVEIARQLGAQVHCHPFQGFGDQRNWAIEHVPHRYPWMLHLDADERLTPELIEEMRREIDKDPPEGGYFIPSKLIFAGKWLRRAGCYPTYQVRLLHGERLRFVNQGHGQRELTRAPLGRLREPYLHLAFSKGLDHWFAKHARYARLEAEEAMREFEKGDGEGLSALFSADPTKRRRALKRFTQRLPGRYYLRLGYMLLCKGAFLDGPAGIAYAHMLATYEAMIDVHLKMLRNGLKA